MSSNPVFKRAEKHITRADVNTATVNGAINKTGILTLILMVTASITWSNVNLGETPYFILPFILIGFLGGLYIIFNPQVSPLGAPLYAAVEGVVLGGLSAFAEAKFPGIVTQAVLITFGILITMILVYKFRVIKVTNQFYKGVVAATGGICIVYLVSIFLQAFTGNALPYIHEGGWRGIGFSLFVIVIAALNLVLDFHNIEVMTKRRVPKFMEWYGAFGIMVTLIWLYIEVLNLLRKK